MNFQIYMVQYRDAAKPQEWHDLSGWQKEEQALKAKHENEALNPHWQFRVVRREFTVYVDHPLPE